MIKVSGKDGKEEVNDYQSKGVENEIKFFAQAVLGQKDEPEAEGKGEPRGAIRDVAVIEASLTSEGQLVDLKKLLEES